MKNSLTTRLRISRTTAFVAGILLPVLETIRRWDQLLDAHYFISWFDDYVIGGFLFLAAWKSKQTLIQGRQYLIAAWGFATGMAFSSFFMQLQNLDTLDPAPITSSGVAIIKGLMLLICILCFAFSLEHARPEK